jgi:hypothetical protein
VSNLNLEELLNQLSDEQGVELDWAAPDAGQYPPVAKPGNYDFVFKLRDNEGVGGFSPTPYEIEGKTYLQVIFDADLIVDNEVKTLTYQKVTDYKHPKMPLSSIAELSRSLKLRPINNPPTRREWIELLQSASGHARGRAKLVWRFRDEVSGITYCTSPRKRKDKATGQKVRDTEWPRNADGTFIDTVTDSEGNKHYGQAELVSYFSPAASADTASA